MADGSLSQFKATLARKMARKEKAQGKFDRKKLGFKSSNSKLAYDSLICGLDKKKLEFKRNELTANGEEYIFNYKSRKIRILLLFPATRSGQRGNLKDEQYKKLIFGTEKKPVANTVLIASASLFTKILADFLFGLYLLN